MFTRDDIFYIKALAQDIILWIIYFDQKKDGYENAWFTWCPQAEHQLRVKLKSFVDYVTPIKKWDTETVFWWNATTDITNEKVENLKNELDDIRYFCDKYFNVNKVRRNPPSQEWSDRTEKQLDLTLDQFKVYAENVK